MLSHPGKQIWSYSLSKCIPYTKFIHVYLLFKFTQLFSVTYSYLHSSTEFSKAEL